MLNRIVSVFIKVFAFIATAALALAMLLTSADVILRYFFNSPIPGTYELVELTMGIFSPVAIMYCVWKKEHISVDIIFDRLPKAVQHFSVGLTLAIQFCITGLLTYQSIALVRELIVQQTNTPILALPYWPIGCVIGFAFAFMLLIYVLQFAAMFIKSNEVESL